MSGPLKVPHAGVLRPTEFLFIPKEMNQQKSGQHVVSLIWPKREILSIHAIMLQNTHLVVLTGIICCLGWVSLPVLLSQTPHVKKKTSSQARKTLNVYTLEEHFLMKVNGSCILFLLLRCSQSSQVWSIAWLPWCRGSLQRYNTEILSNNGWIIKIQMVLM